MYTILIEGLFRNKCEVILRSWTVTADQVVDVESYDDAGVPDLSACVMDGLVPTSTLISQIPTSDYC